MYKYGELQVFDITQKLSCKANCKTPLFFIVNQSSWERLFVQMVVFAIWFEECPYRILEGDGLSVGKCYIDDIFVFNPTLEGIICKKYSKD
jgi:hypothetical protein